jgi:hypothetical protein
MYPRIEQPKRNPDGTYYVRVWRSPEDYEDTLAETLAGAQKVVAALQRARKLFAPQEVKLAQARGRKPMLTPEVHHAIITRIAKKGMKPRHAALATGVSTRSFDRWMKRGEESADENDPYWLFWHGVEVARMQHQEERLDAVLETGRHDWRCHMELLARNYRSTWGRTVKAGEGGERITVTFNKPDINPDEKGDDLVVAGVDDAGGNGKGNGNGS